MRQIRALARFSISSEFPKSCDHVPFPSQLVHNILHPASAKEHIFPPLTECNPQLKSPHLFAAPLPVLLAQYLAVFTAG